MKLKHLEVFHAVMLTGTLSGAARLLHVTQPAATQTLQLAELQLGYALFTRQKNRLVPTPEALALLPEVQKLMGQLEAVRRLAAAQRADAGATLRVLVVPSLAVVQLPAALRLFRSRHPSVRLSIRTLHSREITQALALREADVGIVFGQAATTGLEARAVAQGRLVAVSLTGLGRQGAKGGQGSPSSVTLAEVLRQPFIRIDEQDPLGAVLAEQCNRLGLKPEGEIVVQTHHTALVLAEQGFGPAVIDSFTAAARSSQALVVQAIEPEVQVGLFAVLPQGTRSPRAAAAFIEAFTQAVASA
jgi:DNA-binding transcriptional LysR family regulator